MKNPFPDDYEDARAVTVIKKLMAYSQCPYCGAINRVFIRHLDTDDGYRTCDNCCKDFRLKIVIDNWKRSLRP